MACMRPMLATRGTHVPGGPEWVHEVKWDGIRLLADVRDQLRLWTRNENDATVAWPELVSSAPGRDLLADGEVIALNDDGLPDFGVLQDRMHVRRSSVAERKADQLPATFMAFDLLRLDGRELHDRPLEERRALLADLAGSGDVHGAWQVPAAYDDGQMLHRATFDQRLEGIVSKRRSSRYAFGARSPHWLKFPHRRRASYVVGAWRPETGSTDRLGSVLVGEPTAAGLVYRGRVGSGIAGKAGLVLMEALTALTRTSSPFVDEVPRLDARGSHWVDPVLVVDVDALGMSPQQRLRQPSYRGLRPDLGPEDLV
jgi:bifunctional non-homologous end joining protein LigD